MWWVIRPNAMRPSEFGIAKVSSPKRPNWIVNWTEKNSPRPQVQERAMELPQRTVEKTGVRGEAGEDIFRAKVTTSSGWLQAG